MQVYLGSIWIAAFNFAPRGWALCQGQLLPLNQNQALFALLGTMYGGNGTTNFALPDLRGRVNIGVGQSPGTSLYAQGEKGGVEAVTLGPSQLPLHTHNASFAVTKSAPAAIALTVNVVNSAGNQLSPQGNYIAGGHSPAATGTFLASGTTAAMATGSITINGGTGITGGTVTVGTAGSNAPVSVLQPYLALNYIIATTGIFPSRN